MKESGWGKVRAGLFNFICGVSLLLALWSAMLWVRGYFVSDGYYDVDSVGSISNIIFAQRQFQTHRGGVVAGFSRVPLTPADPTLLSPEAWRWKNTMIATMQARIAARKFVSSPWRQFPSDRWSPTENWPPVEAVVNRPFGGAITISMRAAWWLIVLAFLLLPGLWVYRLGRSRLIQSGFCAECGYNLTGNTSGVCPECGDAVLPRATA